MVNPVNTQGHICPITDEVAEQPVKTRCDHIFDRMPLVQWLVVNPTCPLCRATVREDDLEDVAARVEEVAQEVIMPQENFVDAQSQLKAQRIEEHNRVVDDKILAVLLKITA